LRAEGGGKGINKAYPLYWEKKKKRGRKKRSFLAGPGTHANKGKREGRRSAHFGKRKKKKKRGFVL